jgi:hypothetical protein
MKKAEVDWLEKEESKYARAFSSLEAVRDIPSRYMIMSALSDASKIIGFIYFGFGDKRITDSENDNISEIFDLSSKDELAKISLIKRINKFLLQVSSMGVVASVLR